MALDIGTQEYEMGIPNGSKNPMPVDKNRFGQKTSDLKIKTKSHTQKVRLNGNGKSINQMVNESINITNRCPHCKFVQNIESNVYFARFENCAVIPFVTQYALSIIPITHIETDANLLDILKGF